MSCNSFNFSGCTAVIVGYDFTKKISYSSPSGSAIDLTGFLINMSIQAKNSAVDLLSLSIVGDDQTTGIYIPDPATGEFYIQIRKADSTTLGSGSYDYSIRLTDVSLNESLFMYGTTSFNEVG
tara:strand:- start:483 stop:851 length:369 start_codon:yes stop_codon:yes gene_type:complete